MIHKFTPKNFQKAIFVVLILFVAVGLIYLLFFYLKSGDKKVVVETAPSEEKQEIEKTFQAMFEFSNLSPNEREILINHQPENIREKMKKIMELEEEVKTVGGSDKQQILKEIISLKKEIIVLLEKERKISKNKTIDLSTGPEGYSENIKTSPWEWLSSPELPPGSIVEESSLLEGGEEGLGIPTLNEIEEIPPSTKDYAPSFPN